jgi:hypothetical protein
MATKKPSPYVPSFLKAALSGSRPLQLTFSQVSDTNILSTSSFIYDAPDAPLKSTQQLNVDWSKFENHTFFNSAEAKVNLAFEQVINGFPFDGTRNEVESFFEKMTGYDRWVFDQFPKFHGQLHFSGSQVGETALTAGTYVVTKDTAGALFPELSKTAHGGSVLNPKGTSLSVELELYLPATATLGTQVVFQKMSGSTQGFSLYLLPTSSLTQVEARFSVVSGNFSMTVPCILDKGRFNHICTTWNRETGVHYLEFFKASESNAVSRSRYVIGDLDIDGSEFIIGSGTAITVDGATVTPLQTLSGTIDEFRLFHEARSASQQEAYAPKAIFTTDSLKLYYKFNEPPTQLTLSPTDTTNAIVIDSSGNSLHSLISNYFQFVDVATNGTITGSKLRQDASEDPTSQVIFEKEESCPVLFPAHPDVLALNTELLSSASEYDKANPNLITRLIPQHYLLEGGAYEGFGEPEGETGAPYAGDGIPGQGKMGSIQLMLSLLYIWARFFDEMKLYVDAFSLMRTVDYDRNISMPNNFLRDLITQYGFHLPPLFNDATLEQYLRAENIDPEISSSETPLKFVQHELMRRVLINLPDVIKSKGTQHSIKAFLRAIGIDPENSVRIREYGGPTERVLTYSRESKREVGTMVEFISSSLAVSPYLSASRVEVGFPYPAGTFVQKETYHPHGISNNPNDGLLTSGSWTVETIVRYPKTSIKAMTSATQSLARLCTTGSAGTELIANLLAVSSSVSPKLMLYARPGTGTSSPTLVMQMEVPDYAIFDGEHWNVSFGCERNDSIGSQVSSSYFLRIGNQQQGEISYLKMSSSFFLEATGSAVNVLRQMTGSANASGTFVAVGMNQSLLSGTGGTFTHLNNILAADQEARVTDFQGWMSNLRFWSKALSEDEWKEHIRNYRSLGVEDPLTNYNFTTTNSGSFERVRMDSMSKQETRRANATASLGPLGSITFLDFSLNGNHMTGSGFPQDKDCVRGELFELTYLSPYFDEASTNEKIRIRSFLNQDLVDATPWAGVAPIYEIVKSEQPTDDIRFSVEFSLVDALNRDIVTLFATMDAIDNALGAPELVYSPDYPDLDRLREIYFNRIREKLNFKAFFEFFRWFDTSIGTFIDQLIPRKTRFKGTDFVIESHMLERHKLEYLSSEMYLGEADRHRIRDVLLLQQLAGTIRKY